jgi:phosphatidylglycerophosphate synthase
MSKPFLFQYGTIPLSWPITWLAQRLGFTPNGATAVRAAVVGCGLALTAAPWSIIHQIGVAIYFLALVLDNVDGNLSRMQDDASHLGKFLDGLVDSISEALLPFAIGLHFWLAAGSGNALWLGAGTSFLLISLQGAYLRFAIAAKEIASAPIDASGPRRYPGVAPLLEAGLIAEILRPVERHGLDVLWDARYGGFLLALAVGETEFYLAAIFTLHLAVWAVLVAARVARALVELDIHRKSRSAADYNRGSET